MIFAIADGSKGMSGMTWLYALIAIVIVFAVLLIIIGITYLIFKLLGLFEMKKELDSAKKGNESKVEASNTNEKVEIKDEDMMVAALVASIDYQNETKSNVRIKSIKEIK